jgi:hypothetical protein
MIVTPETWLVCMIIMMILSFALIGFMVWVSQYEKEHPPPKCTRETMGYCK